MKNERLAVRNQRIITNVYLTLCIMQVYICFFERSHDFFPHVVLEKVDIGNIFNNISLGCLKAHKILQVDASIKWFIECNSIFRNYIFGNNFNR